LPPLQPNFRRNVEKKLAPSGLRSRTERAARLSNTVSPASNPLKTCPSAVIVASNRVLNIRTPTVDARLNTIGRIDNVCGQIGVNTITSASGLTIDPPADNEYAVDPVGDDAIKPSQR
jgi:hypothetical protein